MTARTSTFAWNGRFKEYRERRTVHGGSDCGLRAVRHNVDLIFTYVCAFEMQEERDYLQSLHDLFTENGGRFFFVELSAELETRITRNETPHRMERKASKRDVEWSRANLLKDAREHRLNSAEGETWFTYHLKIDNTELSPDEVADRVIEAFGLTPLETP